VSNDAGNAGRVTQESHWRVAFSNPSVRLSLRLQVHFGISTHLIRPSHLIWGRFMRQCRIIHTKHAIFGSGMKRRGYLHVRADLNGYERALISEAYRRTLALRRQSACAAAHHNSCCCPVNWLLLDGSSRWKSAMQKMQQSIEETAPARQP